MNIRTGLIVTAIVLTTAPAYGQQTDDCAKLKNSSKRLACFDTKAKSMAAKAEEEKKQREAEEELRKKNEAEQQQRKERDDFLAAARPSLLALQKLRARVGVGVSFRDYFSPLSDANFELENFLRSPRTAYEPEFQRSVSRAFMHYSAAGEQWKIAVRSAGKLLNDEIVVLPDFVAKYPELSRYTRQQDEWTLVSYKRILSVVWNEAEKEIGNAEEILNKVQNRK